MNSILKTIVETMIFLISCVIGFIICYFLIGISIFPPQLPFTDLINQIVGLGLGLLFTFGVPVNLVLITGFFIGVFNNLFMKLVPSVINETKARRANEMVHYPVLIYSAIFVLLAAVSIIFEIAYRVDMWF